MDCGLPDSSVYQDSPGKNTGVGSHSLLDLPDPGIKPRSPALQADSLSSEPPGKSCKNFKKQKQKHANQGVDF